MDVEPFFWGRGSCGVGISYRSLFQLSKFRGCNSEHMSKGEK